MKFSPFQVFQVLLLIVLGWCGPARAALQIDVGNHVVPASSNQFQVPIQISGGDLVTDMAGAVQIGWDGGPLVGGERGPVIKSISHAGTIWAGAPGGFDVSATIPLTNQLYDPNVSLRVAGQRVAGSGRLFTLTIDVTGLAPGLHELRLAQVQGLSTSFQNTGTNVPVTIVNGLIAIGTTVPTVSPRSSIAALTNGHARLSWTGEAGRRYRVQWKSEASGPWAEVKNDLNVNGAVSEIAWVDDGTAIGLAPGLAAGRFYRVRIAR